LPPPFRIDHLLSERLGFPLALVRRRGLWKRSRSRPDEYRCYGSQHCYGRSAGWQFITRYKRFI